MDDLLRRGGIQDLDTLRQDAPQAAWKLHGPDNLAQKHDEYFAEALER